jgi:hypothetical protein
MAAHNGLAGVALLRDDRVSARVHYETALRLVEQYDQQHNVVADKLPVLHTVHHFIDLLADDEHERAAQLRQLYDTTYDEYLSDARLTNCIATQAYLSKLDKVDEKYREVGQ